MKPATAATVNRLQENDRLSGAIGSEASLPLPRLSERPPRFLTEVAASIGGGIGVIDLGKNFERVEGTEIIRRSALTT